jgi:hypothetical protein
MSDFSDCLFNRDLRDLHALAACLHQLHEAMADDTSRLAAHLEEQHQLLLRRCDLCGENLTRHAVWELLTVVEGVIAKREEEQESTTDD